MTTEFILAGFGGQGILFAGKILAYCGLMAGKELSWLPSYGPEMRGGTANCSVCISDEPIGSPVVTTPDYLIAMNGPSYKKFIDAVKPDGLVLFDNSIVEETCDFSAGNGHCHQCRAEWCGKHGAAGQNAGRNQPV